MKAKEIEEKRIHNMAKLMLSQPAGEERIATPPLSPSQVQASGFQWGGALKRADLRAYASGTSQSQQSEDQPMSTKRVYLVDNNLKRQLA
jgi:hypothetical protein